MEEEREIENIRLRNQAELQKQRGARTMSPLGQGRKPKDSLLLGVTKYTNKNGNGIEGGPCRTAHYSARLKQLTLKVSEQVCDEEKTMRAEKN